MGIRQRKQQLSLNWIQCMHLPGTLDCSWCIDSAFCQGYRVHFHKLVTHRSCPENPVQHARFPLPVIPDIQSKLNHAQDASLSTQAPKHINSDTCKEMFKIQHTAVSQISIILDITKDGITWLVTLSLLDTILSKKETNHMFQFLPQLIEDIDGTLILITDGSVNDSDLNIDTSMHIWKIDGRTEIGLGITDRSFCFWVINLCSTGTNCTVFCSLSNLNAHFHLPGSSDPDRFL